MNILITLYYNAELGGLHDNVFATAVEAKKRGYNVFVACRLGKFNNKLNDAGINTITINQDKLVDTLERIVFEMGTNIDLIHAHPGNSRIVAMRLHKKYNIPVIYHVHGSWLDGVEKYIDKVNSVFAVSESVKQKIINVCSGYEYKIHVIPNYSEYNHDSIPELTNQKTISLIARLDTDKKLILDEFYKLIPYLNNMESAITINIIGDGSLRNEFLNYLNQNIENELININYIGWIEQKEKLKILMLNSTIIIGAGRVAIDGLTLNRPVIISGAKSYQGIINTENWQSLISNNFGEVDEYDASSNIIDDVDNLLNDKSIYEKSIKTGQLVIKTFFDKKNILNKHFMIYSILTFDN